MNTNNSHASQSTERSHTLSVVIYRAQYELILTLAKKYGVNASEYMRTRGCNAVFASEGVVAPEAPPPTRSGTFDIARELARALSDEQVMGRLAERVVDVLDRRTDPKAQGGKR